ncbi:hypothetical protein [Streptomyces sp. A0592]|uniref:hypothetical protein n=1 Tax=Streptomyces sp. A0592 TaxID=2563099 RepID=UPI00109E381A|nr:hypothetical protein [Streptomyces sp. A0592]THA74875.1 hypothetical protein E6U81_37285 [Streptomyces sp. A0592]
MEVAMRIVFDPAEQEALRADAREMADGDPRIAYVLERLAGEGVDLDAVTSWEELRDKLGQPPLDDSAPTSHVA